jgi:uncharacterized phage protein (TIGR02220 family)
MQGVGDLKKNKGYIKLHRTLMDSRVWRNEGLLKVWAWCLLKASYKEHWVSVPTGKGTTEVCLLPGQFICGRNTAAEELNMKPSTVSDRLKKLENIENIDIQPDTHFSIITVIKWEEYQGDDEEDQQATQHPSDTQPTGNQQATDTYKKVKKDKNKDIVEIIEYLNKISGKSFNPNAKATASHINARLMEKYTMEQFKAVMDAKVGQWINDPKMNKYIRPQTLFGTKFDSYLQEATPSREDNYKPMRTIEDLERSGLI